MKFILFLIIMLSLGCSTNQAKITKKWEFSEQCSAPESVYYDKNLELIFVSNIVGDGVTKDSKGHISLLSKDGRVIEAQWVKGLNAPKGMRSYKGKLWVSDIDEVLVIDIKTKKIVRKIKIKGAKFLNDIVIDRKGIVFVSDSLTSTIHKIVKNRVSVFLKGKKLESPNGLLIAGNSLYVAAWGFTTDWSTKVPGRLYSINLKTKKISFITKEPLGNLDGLEINDDGDFLISDWVAGKIYKVTRKGEVSLFYTGQKGLADIGYIPGSGDILVPQMLNHFVLSINEGD